MRRSNPNIIRVGDKVEIVDPLPVLRVGYPRTVTSYEAEGERLCGPEMHALNEKAGGGIRCELQRLVALRLARADKFGGTERNLHHAAPREDLRGRVGRVDLVRTRMVGHYDDGERPSDSDGTPNYEAPSLRVRRAHRLAEVFITHGDDAPDLLWFEVERLRKVEK